MRRFIGKETAIGWQASVMTARPAIGPSAGHELPSWQLGVTQPAASSG